MPRNKNRPAVVYPTGDPEWKNYMKMSFFAGAEMYDVHCVQYIAKKLAWPMAPAGPDRSKLSKGALKSLQDAEALFVSKLSEASDDPSTPTIEDLLKPELRADYVKNLEMDTFGNVGGFSLYVKAPGERFEVKHYQRQGKQLDELVVKHYADESFKPLIYFHLPETAGKVLAAEISKWPGCYAKRVFLSDEEKLKHGFKCKAPVAFTHVAISKEGGKAFKSGEVMEPTKAQLACKRFYDERCAAGTPGFRIAFRIPDGIVHKPFNIEEYLRERGGGYEDDFADFPDLADEDTSSSGDEPENENPEAVPSKKPKLEKAARTRNEGRVDTE